MQYKVFVYGTLKSGQCNHAVLGPHACLIGPASSVIRWKFIALDFYPAMLRADGPCCVEGEVWQVDADTLARLDVLEEVPHLYTRHEIEVRFADGRIDHALSYFMQPGFGAVGVEIMDGRWPLQEGQRR
ncbi:gamma-glutamylcyclotransferase [Herbaspirillum lusitanum]|uniref:Gamma-glutamylcyclotransferase family protein n=1 Tax=Herbaspirillum lusitanum TaxID=213312 RepID=A0ABW9AGE7_9BURK